MLTNVLARVAGVIGDIVSAPVRFLGNLIEGVKGGRASASRPAARSSRVPRSPPPCRPAGTGSPGTCIFEDRAGRAIGVTLAHEIGHHLGLNHTGHRKIDLMFDFTDQRGFNLTKDDVNTANP